MRILVTGGAGYLGSEVARQAVGAGDEAVATWLHRPAIVGLPLRLDLADAAAVTAAIANMAPEAVVHTAYRQPEEHLARDVVAATANVARAAAAAAARLVHVSTDLVFDGEREPPGRYREEDEPHPVSAYGRAKLEAEHRVRSACAAALIVRTSLLYGRPDGPQEALARRDDVVFYTDEMRSPLHVGDLAAALLELAARDESGILHVAGPDTVSRYQLARRLAPDRRIRGAPSPAGGGRARNVALDSTRASGLLRTRLRGIEEALHSLHS